MESIINTQLFNTLWPVLLHGEKVYETLVNREEMVRAEDVGNYFRISADSRDLNYERYFTEGESAVSKMEDYTSHNTTILDVKGIKELLLKLNEIEHR